ncbi:MAG: hypothetical protein HS116_00010 [Planctomycetes bacterium]|nr:hypothetical protein [Planctomycetota bacterium]
MQGNITPGEAAPGHDEAAPGEPVKCKEGCTATGESANKEGDTVDLLDLLESPQSAGLEVVRLGDSETAVIPFTREGARVKLHYCEEPEIRGYAHCTDSDCVLCRIGRKAEDRMLLPVYLPAARVVSILAVSPSLRPYALLPQLAPALKATTPTVAFIRRDGSRYLVTTRQLHTTEDAGADVIKGFFEKHDAKQIELGSVYPRLSNDQLAAVSEIGRLLALKEGIRAGG